MWSWIIAGTGIAAMWLAGYDDARRHAGWALAIVGQGLWIVYALQTAQYGFVAGAIVAGAVFGRNAWRAWRRP